MPLDTSIYSWPTGQESQRDALSMRAALNQARAQEMQLAAAEREVEDDNRLRQAYSEAQGDLDRFLNRATQLQVSPDKLTKIQDSILSTRKKYAELDTEKRNALKFKTEAMHNASQLLLNQPAERRSALYPGIREMLVTQGHLKPEEIPDQYPGDEWLVAHADAVKLQAAELAKAEETRKQAAELRAVESHTAAIAESQARLPGIAAQSLTSQLGAAERTMPDNQDDWSSWRAGLPDTLRKRVPAMYSPEAAKRVASMAMTAGERASAERAAAEFAEQKRRNQATEAETKRGHDITVRGQNMTDARVRMGLEDGSAELWANRIASGQAKLTEAPQRLRTGVLNVLERNGVQLLNPKQREGLDAMQTAEGLVGDIEGKALKVNQSYGVRAKLKGGLQTAAAWAQMDPEAQALQRAVGLLGNLARSLGGERGVLTEGDIGRVVSLIPVLGDSNQVTQDKIRDLKKFVENKREAIYSQTSQVRKPGQQSEPKNSDPAGLR